MWVSITLFTAKSLWYVVPFLRLVFRIETQLQTSPGLIASHKGVYKGNPYLWYTITHWESRQQMLDFKYNGEHLAAMKQVGRMASYTKGFGIEVDHIASFDEVVEAAGWFPSKSSRKADDNTITSHS